MSRRPTWLLATVTALYAFQAPVCAIACLDDSASDTVAAQQDTPPCHEGTPAAPTREAPTSDEACDSCESAVDALKQVDSTGAQPLFAAHCVALRWDAPIADLSRVSAAPERADLPPPDILLLESILLL